MTSKPTLILALVCAFLAGALSRDLLVHTAHADDPRGFRAQDVRELLSLVEKNADATKAVADAVRSLKR